jgi:nicotinamide mononucleotide transporter
VTFTPLETAAVVFTLCNVWLAVKENIWTWPTGIVSVLLYLVVNWQAHLYANAMLQVLYFALSIHGWYEWLHGGKNRSERQITLATPAAWAMTLGGGALLTLPIFYLLRMSGSSSSPVMDAATTAYSIVGQVLLNLKITENWIIWALVDIVYVVIYVQQSLRLTAILYAFFVLLCLKGYIDWRRTAVAVVRATGPLEL